ncbi:hypothetical protein ACF09H_16170 [Streptomyces sp. NPDC014983]|uniref:hypothetical protein n=1 Tax=Streptomyces sp. NPDC014983 TaxID=3364933 RepID=UPI003701F363
MAFGAPDLLPGEAVRLGKNANAVVSVDASGLSRFAFDQLMWTVGMTGREAIGGKLHVTDHRLVFDAHPVNRLRGRFSIFLPLITDVRDTSRGIKKQIQVSTGTQQFTFVVWGVPRLIATIDHFRRAVTPEQARRLAGAALADYARVGEGLRIAPGIEAANIALREALPAVHALRSAITPSLSPVELAGALGLLELLDRLERDAR